MIRSSFAKGVAAAAAGAMALSVVGGAVAQAQPAPPPGYYPPPPAADPGCKAEANSRGVVGALLGAGIGAVLGSHIAANHHRSDGGLVGGGVGALAGAAVGSSSAHCGDGYAPPPPPPPVAYAPPPVAYAPPPVAYYAPPPAPVIVYGYHGERFRLARAIGPDGCALAERPVVLPDGRVEPGFVRVCRGWHGRFYIVG